RIVNDSKAESELLDILRRCYANLPEYNQFSNFALESAGRAPIESRNRTTRIRSHRSLADELIFLGLYDEGAPELRAGLGAGGDVELAESDTDDGAGDNEAKAVPVAQRRRRGGAGRASTPGLSGSWQYSLAVYLNRGSHAHPAIRYGESKFSNVPNDFRLDLLPRDIAELIYPAPYRDDLSAQTRKRNLDSRFMLAIARQESRFDSSAKSAAAARGIFQFI